MKPFRIDWTLSMPMVMPEHPIHLDAILAAVRVERAAGEADPLAAQHDLPLEKEVCGESWVWKASAIQSTPALPLQMCMMTRRTDAVRLAFDRETIVQTRLSIANEGTGLLKNYDLRFAVQWHKSLSAWGVGDIDQVRDLLASVRYLGKMRRNGWGQIKECRVEADDLAMSHWSRRTLPESMAGLASSQHAPTVAVCSPPYWNRAQAEPAFRWCGM
jgi:CRISPR type IV-associated protein Csf3